MVKVAFIIFLLSLGGIALGQDINISDLKSFNVALDGFIEENFLESVSDELKIYFTIKVDSLGEVHSAHIRLSRNLKFNKYYQVCYEIESKYKMKFVFDKYKNTYEFLGKKYVIASIPYKKKI